MRHPMDGTQGPTTTLAMVADPADGPFYPPIEPYESGMLDVGDSQAVHWEVSGHPRGKAVVVLHGGPGSASSPGRRQWFDPQRYRIVQFDQRGCGRSTPHAADATTSLSSNTTHHLLADIERLREHLGVARWLVAGWSWGVTLGLAYAERYPQHVSEMVLGSIAMTNRADVRWFATDAGRFFPEQWAAFRAGVPPEDRDGDLVAAYDRLLNGPSDPAVRLQAARDWVAWEDAVLSSTTATSFRTLAIWTNGSRSPSSASSPTTSRTRRGSGKMSSSATPRDWSASRPS
jgi:proline iminopeptidase